MIEINLLPGAPRKKRRAGGGFSLSLPKMDQLPEVDRWILFIVAAWVIGPGLTGWMYFGVTGKRDDLTVRIEAAVQDSMRYARLIQASSALEARRDTIMQKLEIIEQIDTKRYVWAHVMDEISRALPDYTWLTNLAQTGGGMTPVFLIEGRTGNFFALTRFMDDLEASPFIRAVRLTTTQQESLQGRIVNQFVLEATYEEPPPDMIETVPLLPETSVGEDNGPPTE